MDAAKKYSNLLPLLGRLSKEPVVLEFDLAGKPVGKLADEIDLADRKADAITDDEVRKERLKASVERCRQAFALILLEIPPDSMGEVQKMTMAELLAGTPAPALKVVPNEPAPLPEESMQTLPETAPPTKNPPPPPGAPKAPPKVPPSLSAKPAPPTAAAAPPPPPSAPLVPPPAPTLPAMDATAVGELPAAAEAPVAAEPPAPEPASQPEDEDPPEEEKSYKLIDEPSLVTIPKPPPAALSAESALSKQWLEFAYSLEEVAGSKLPNHHLTRLVLQHQILALENDCQEKLAKCLKKIWPERKNALLQYLDPQTQTVAAPVHHFLKSLQTTHPEWIRPFEISIGWLQVMLRYWLSDNPAESFRPSLSECGFIFCLFGQAPVETMEATNLLGMAGVTPEQIHELVARLNRLHRYRNQIFSIREDIDGQACTSIREDLVNCFGLMKKIQLSGGA